MSDIAMVFYSDRLEIERAFNEWADKNGVVKAPNALVAFLDINGLLNTGETVKWCRARRQKKQTEEGAVMELKPCPFCGSQAEYYGECNIVKVRCHNHDCRCQLVTWFDEPEDAAEAWNRRAPE